MTKPALSVLAFARSMTYQLPKGWPRPLGAVDLVAAGAPKCSATPCGWRRARVRHPHGVALQGKSAGPFGGGHPNCIGRSSWAGFGRPYGAQESLRKSMSVSNKGVSAPRRDRKGAVSPAPDDRFLTGAARKRPCQTRSSAGRVPKRIASLPGFILVFILSLVFNSVSFAQGQTIFFEDFETGDPLQEGWTVEGIPVVLWHIAEDGECLSETRMGSYNRAPACCDYAVGCPTCGRCGFCGAACSGHQGRLKSPPFLVTGEPIFTLFFDYKRSVNPSGDSSCVEIVDVETGVSDVLGCAEDNSGTLQPAEMQVPDSLFWAGRAVRIEFCSRAGLSGSNNPGWFVDNVEFRNSSPEGPVPTLSEWGLVMMTLLVLTSGTIVFGGRARAARGLDSMPG